MQRIVKCVLSKRLYSSTAGKVKAQKYVLTKHFEGEPKKSDFKIVEEELPDLQDGEILTQAEYFSVDPYMRAYMMAYKLPADMIGGQVAKVVESKNDKYPVGRYIVGSFGWRTHTIYSPKQKPSLAILPIFMMPDIAPLPLSLGLGVLGMPGNTAYFGMKEICKPKAGETLVISGAAGAVGTHVGQIAKHVGCRVIGFAGSDQKCDYLEKELGFDKAYNYKKVNVKDALRDGAPKRVDIYFDNVGGEISSKIINGMNKFGRIAVCGSISSYNDAVLPKATLIQPAMAIKELKMEGFIVSRWADRWEEGILSNLQAIKDGKLKYNEKFYHGFENMVEALNGMLRGENLGKAIVKV